MLCFGDINRNPTKGFYPRHISVRKGEGNADIAVYTPPSLQWRTNVVVHWSSSHAALVLSSFTFLLPMQKYELTFGAPKNTPGSVAFLYIRVFEVCVLRPSNPYLANAYAHYFGCGIHFST